jgi:hypothetical protein
VLAVRWGEPTSAAIFTEEHMRLFHAGIISATLLFAVAGTSAEQKPNFSGTWVVVSPAESAGEETTIKHDATTFTHGHASEGGGHSFAYKLDGTETRITMPSHGEEIVILAKASWDGDRLVVVEQVTYPDGRKADGTTMWSLDAQGQLVSESVRKEEGKPPRTSKVFLKKKVSDV